MKTLEILRMLDPEGMDMELGSMVEEAAPEAPRPPAAAEAAPAAPPPASGPA
jgi:hypothetical protein